MKIYIAARFRRAQERLRPVRDRLTASGHSVVSTWLDDRGENTHAYRLQCAVRDLVQVKESDCIILDTTDPIGHGGREVEWGIALTKLIPKYLVGPPRNVFHLMATRRFESWEDCLNAICGTGASPEA